MGFEQNMPVFLSTPPATEPPHNPIFFTGGLGMTTQSIGFILSMQGVFSMVAQFFLFPPLARYFGVLTLYRFIMITYPISYIMVPYLDFLPERFQLAGIYFVLLIKIIYGVIAYPCNAILLTNSAPSLLVLGAINGIAASCASFARAFSPTVTGYIYGKGLDMGVVGLSWWCNALVCVIGGLQCLTMRTEDFEGQHDDELERTLDADDVEHIAVKSQVAHEAIPIVSAEGAINEYGLVLAAVDGEISSLCSYTSAERGFAWRHGEESFRARSGSLLTGGLSLRGSVDLRGAVPGRGRSDTLTSLQRDEGRSSER